MNILPNDSLLEDRLGIVGTSGSGKTYAAGVLIETILTQKQRVIIVDPLGVWWGLRLRADGEVPSKFDPVIFGGKHGDLPLSEMAGEIIGETVAKSSQSCIIDLSLLGMKAKERRFMLAFLTALYRATENSPVHIIFDEADMWAPQVLLDKDGETARLLGMMETVVRRGRVKGFVPWLITQRPAVLSKNVLSQIDGIIAMKLTSSQDREAIGAWVEGQADKSKWKELYAALATMARGEGVVWVPGRAIMKTSAFPQKTTFDSSRTPKRGEAASAVRLMAIDIGALKEKLATVEVEAKANDPRELRAEIARLKAQIQKHSGFTQEDIHRAHADGYANGARAVSMDLRDTAFTLKTNLVTLGKSVDALILVCDRMLEQIGISQERKPVTPAPKLPAAPQIPPGGHTVEGGSHTPNKAAPPRTGVDLSPSARKILDVIHKTYPQGISFAAAARRAGVSKQSSAYRTFKTQVITSGEVEGSDARLISVAGYGRSEPVPPGAAVDSWAAKLKPSVGALLKAIADGWKMKHDIARAAGVSLTSSGLSSGLRELVELELVTVDNGQYLLAEGM